MAGRIILHPDAWDEYFDASAWYHARDPQAAINFEAVVDGALAEIADNPMRWPLIDRWHRRRVLTRFPYSIIYRVAADHVRVIAISHAKRRTGYWRKRR